MSRRRFATILLTLAAAPACGSSPTTSKGSAVAGDTSDATAPLDAGSIEPDALADASSSGGDSSPPADAQSPADVTVPPDAQFLGDAAGAPRTFTVVNQCAQTIWAAALPATTFPGGDVEMPPGYAFEVGVDDRWSGRIWGKVDCSTTGGKLTCASDSLPASLAELTLTMDPTGLDFYDVSLVDGFDLPMALIAVGFTADPAHPYSCGAPTCSMDLRPECPMPLRDLDASSQTIVCANDACKVIGKNNATDPTCIYPNQYTEFFKTSCPQAYSYPSDDPTSTFTCKGKDYHVVFCP
jgi:hypothetical protein